MGIAGHSFVGGAVDPEAELAGEPDRPQHPELVLSERQPGIPDGPDQAPFQVLPSLGEVDDPFGARVQKKSIDGEVPPQRVLPRIGETDFLRMSSVGVAGLGSKGGDLVVDAADHGHYDAEFAAHSDGARKESLDDAGRRRCRDVDLVEGPVQEQVPDGASGEIDLEIFRRQNLSDVERALQQACLDSFQHSPPLRFVFRMGGSGPRVRFGSWPGPELL